MKSILFIVIVIGISAVLGAFIIGTRTFDGTVIDKPYEHGLEYDEIHHNHEASGWKTEISNRSFKTGANRVELIVNNKENKPLTGVAVKIKLSRPSTSEYDKSYQATTDEFGRISVDIDIPVYGYWNLELKISDGNKTVLFEKSIFAEADKKR